MSTHPNAILLLELTPDDLARKTYRSILAEANAKEEDEGGADIKIGGFEYHTKVMEESYDEGFQIQSKEGAIVLHDYVTYGYGERIEWDELTKQKDSLETWARGICERHKCSYKIYITANYW